jgi:hypothetical protein
MVKKRECGGESDDDDGGDGYMDAIAVVEYISDLGEGTAMIKAPPGTHSILAPSGLRPQVSYVLPKIPLNEETHNVRRLQSLPSFNHRPVIKPAEPAHQASSPG